MEHISHGMAFQLSGKLTQTEITLAGFIQWNPTLLQRYYICKMNTAEIKNENVILGYLLFYEYGQLKWCTYF